jgi:hypothetical protein
VSGCSEWEGVSQYPGGFYLYNTAANRPFPAPFFLYKKNIYKISSFPVHFQLAGDSVPFIHSTFPNEIQTYTKTTKFKF